jgi:hypothetical protein
MNIKKIIYNVTFFVLTFFLLSTYAFAATYYVDATNGNDTNDGLSTSAPWETIAKVNASNFNPGDQILFKRGQIWREQFTMPSSGSEGNPITFGAYGNGNKPVISGADIISGWSADPYYANIWSATVTSKPNIVWLDGTVGTNVTSKAAVNGPGKWYAAGNTLFLYSTVDPSTVYTSPGVEAGARDYAIYNSTKNYVTIQNLTAKNANVQVVRLRNCTNNILDTMNIYNAPQHTVLVDIGGGTHNIQNCEIYNAGIGNTTMGVGCGILTVGTTTGIIVQNNYIHDIGGTMGDHGVYASSGANIVRYNHMKNILGYLISVTKAAHNTQVYYNIAENCRGLCNIGLHSDGVPEGILIENNTVVNSESRGVLYWGDGVHTGTVVKNNIFFNSGVPTFAAIDVKDSGVGFTSDYNCFYTDSAHFASWLGSYSDSLTAWQTASGQDAHSVNSNPLFVSTPSPDFHLQPTSPCINAGVNVGLTQDYDGKSVPKGGTPDIGAFEYEKYIAPPTNVNIITP